MNAFNFDVSGYKTSKYAQGAFKDILFDEWYYPYANFVIKNNLLDGIRNRAGTIISVFGPGRSITRGEMAKFAIKTMQYEDNMEE